MKQNPARRYDRSFGRPAPAVRTQQVFKAPNEDTGAFYLPNSHPRPAPRTRTPARPVTTKRMTEKQRRQLTGKRRLAANLKAARLGYR